MNYPDNNPDHRAFKDNIFPNKNHNQSPRNYRCPECGGEFQTWDRKHVHSDKKCPFCGRKKGEYDRNINDIDASIDIEEAEEIKGEELRPHEKEQLEQWAEEYGDELEQTIKDIVEMFGLDPDKVENGDIDDIDLLNGMLDGDLDDR